MADPASTWNAERRPMIFIAHLPRQTALQLALVLRINPPPMSIDAALQTA